MPQKRIDEASAPRCKQSKSFLDLPPSVRQHVYEEAGLWIGKDLGLMRWPRVTPGTYRRIGHPLGQVRDNFVYNILRTCRTIHNEVKFLVCSRNRLVISHYDVPYGLQYLNGLPPQICSQLGDLFVHLYLDPDHGCLDGCSRPTVLDPDFIEAWQSAIGHVLTHANPQKLKLHLICETGNSEATRAVLQPLIDHPGRLADCSLSLHFRRNSRTSALARRAALQTKGMDPDPPKMPFRFLDLPAELRLRILEFTDLVVPCGEAQWSPKKGFFVYQSGDFCRESKYRTNLGDRDWDYQTNWEPSKNNAMTLYPCAYVSGYSSSCHCWRPPDYLMLVNHSTYQQAIAVFYSRNRIINVPDPSSYDTNLRSQDRLGRLGASRFITRHVYPTMLSHLREIELVFPGLHWDGRCSQPHYPLILDWRFAVDHLRSHANLPVLKLMIHMRMNLDGVPEGSGSDFTQRAFKKYSDYCYGDPGYELRPHIPFLEPLQVLREGGLSQLFIFLESVWHWSPRTGGPWETYDWCDPRDSLNDHVELLETRLEKMVMGEDYDSSAAGKMKECRSQWMPFDGL